MANRRYQLQNGTLLDDRYRIRGVLGEGGFGITYDAENERIGMRVAIKEFFCRDFMDRHTDETNEISLFESEMEDRFEKEKARFLKEARTLRDFNNEQGIVHVNDYFESNGTAYIVMSYLEGMTLREFIKKNGRMDAEQVFRQMKPLLRTLSKIHDTQMIHRDISPDNIMVSPDGELILIDFGAAYSYNKETKSYAAIYKSGYASAEQYKSDGSAGPPADIYSICATIYYCLTGADPEDSLQRILMDDLKRPSALGVSIPQDAEEIVMKGMALKPAGRYQDAKELLADMERLYPEETGDKESGQRKSRMVAGVVSAIAVLAAIIGFLFWWTQRVEYRFRNIDTEVIYLSPPKDISVAAYTQSANAIRQRVEVFAGRNNYRWDEIEGEIRMEFPVDLMQTFDPSMKCRAFLTRPGDMYLSVEEPYATSKQDDSWEHVGVSQDGIASIEEERGEIPGFDREEENLPKTGEYDYLRLTFTPDQIETIHQKYRDVLYTEGSRMWISYDITVDTKNYVDHACFTTGDGQSVIFTDESLQLPQFRRAYIYGKTHESPETVFGVTARPVVEWEVAESSLVPGKYQCNERDIGNAYHQFLFDATNATKDNNAAWIHDVIVFKNRLDALEIPYAIGTLPYNDGAIVVRTEKDALSQYVIDTLGTDDAVSGGMLYRYGEDSDSISLDLLRADNDGTQWTIPFSYEWSEETRKEWIDKNAGASKGYYLVVGNYNSTPIARVDWNTLESHIPENEVVLTELYVNGKEDTIGEATTLLEYLKELASEDPVNEYYITQILNDQKDGCQWNPFEELPDPIFPEQTALAEKMIEDLTDDNVIVEFFPGQYYPVQSGTPLWGSNPKVRIFYYDRDDGTYVVDALKEVRKIYETYLKNEVIGNCDLYFNRGEEGDPDFAQIGVHFYSGRLWDTPYILSASVQAKDSAALKKEADAYIEQDDVLKALLDEDWRGFYEVSF